MPPKPFYTDGPNVELYDVLHESPHAGAIRGDVAFYLRRARRTGGPVLELGCGTGRVALPLARAGHEVVGLDRAAGMLAIARRKAKDLPDGSRIRFARGSMERFELGRRFRLILIPFRSFQILLTPAAQRRCLEAVRRHLAPGGRFIVNLFDPRLEYLTPGDGTGPVTRATVRHPVTGRRWDLRTRDRICDPLTQVFEETWEWTERGRGGRVLSRRRDRLVMRWTYRTEMRHLLEIAGFRVVACPGDFRGGPARYGAEQIWITTAAARSRRRSSGR